MGINDIKPSEFIEKAAEELKKMIEQPEWSMFVKTGIAKSRPPEKQDWYYARAAAVLRKVYIANGPIGVSKLRTKFGSKKRRGTKPEKFFKASGKIIRSILQQLEKNKLIEQKAIGFHKGRIITKEGRKLVDGIAKR